jgi:electron transfer flavoprotein beta subunit
MRSIVCVKRVPDTESKIRVGAGGDRIDEANLNFILNPYDEYAVEEALRQKEAAGSGSVSVVTVGNEQSVTVLRTCLAMGADDAYLLEDKAFEGGDALGTARVLAAAIRKIPYDLLFFGKQGMGEDNNQVGAMVAELLNLPHISEVVKLEAEGSRVTARREIEGATEVVESPIPVVLTAQKGLNEPRYPSLRGIMAAKKKPIQKWAAGDLGLDPSEVGAAGSKVKWAVLELPPEKQGGKKLQGEPEQMVRAIVQYLSGELKLF